MTGRANGLGFVQGLCTLAGCQNRVSKSYIEMEKVLYLTSSYLGEMARSHIGVFDIVIGSQVIKLTKSMLMGSHHDNERPFN